MSDLRLIQNAVRIMEPGFPDTYLLSLFEDDTPVHEYKDGRKIALCGGTSYALRGGDYIQLDEEGGHYEEWTLSNEDSFEVVANRWLVRLDTGVARPVRELSLDELRTLVTQDSDEVTNRVAWHWIRAKTDSTISSVQ